MLLFVCLYYHIQVYINLKSLPQESPAFQCNEDKVDGMIGEAVNFLFEFSYMSSMSASFGYALEKVFNCGDIGIRWMCKILAFNTRSRNAGAVSELSGVTNIRPLFTWETEISGVREDIESMSDEATLNALESMLRPGHVDGHMQNYETKTLFDNHPGLKKKVDTFRSEGYAAVKRAVAEIRSAMNSTADPEEKIRVAKAAIATIDKKSMYGKRYLPPTDKKEYAIQCAKKLRDVKDVVVASVEVKSLIVVEYETKKQLKPDDAEEHFPSNSIIHKMHNYDGTLAGEVYVYDYKKKTIRILLVPSGHVIRGSCAGVKARMTVGKSMVTIMSYLEEARVVPTSAFERYRDIFYAQAIEMAGLGKKGEVVDYDLVMASVHNARYVASPDGLGSGNPICSGVRGLGELISPVNGIDDLKVVCLMTVLGFKDFMSMMKDIYAVELPCDFSSWLLTLGGIFINDPSIRISVAKALYDNEVNRECAKKTGLPDGWLALKSQGCSASLYAIRCPNGNCYSSINSLPRDISKGVGWKRQPKSASAELIAAQARELKRVSTNATAEALAAVHAEKKESETALEKKKLEQEKKERVTALEKKKLEQEKKERAAEKKKLELEKKKRAALEMKQAAENNKIRTVRAPRGKLGLTLKDRTDTVGGTFVLSVSVDSPLAQQVSIGDRIISIDGTNVGEKNVKKVSTILHNKVHNVIRWLTIDTSCRGHG